MIENWPAGRTEEELLERVYGRARTLRARRRAGAAGVLSVVAAAALVPMLVLHPGQTPQSVSTAGQTSNPSASSVRMSTRGSSPLPGGRDQGGRGAAGTDTSAGPSSVPTTGSSAVWASPKPTTPGTDQSGGSVSGPSAVPSGPRVTSVNPAYGPTTGGTRVTLTGFDLQGVTEVLFGTVKATGITIKSATTLVVVSPASQQPGMVPIGVYDSRHHGYSDATCWNNPLCSDGFLYIPAAGVGNSPSVPIPGVAPALPVPVAAEAPLKNP